MVTQFWNMLQVIFLYNNQILPKIPQNISMYWKLVVLTTAHTKSAIGKNLETFVI